MLDLREPQVMGILNVTPDSFSDGGRYRSLDAARAHARQMVDEGASIIDVGGESTRPGAQAVALQEELDRVLPVIEALVKECTAVISIDTSKPEVMRAAVQAGAGMINDVFALRAPGALQVATDLDVPVCLMHMQGEPRTMQQSPKYDDVVVDVKNFLVARLAACRAAGLSMGRLLIDPGFGFGKTLQHNLQLLHGLAELQALGAPILVGASRKSMLGAVLNLPPAERVAGSVAAAVMAVERGAAIIRAHDVAPTVQALRVCAAVMNA